MVLCNHVYLKITCGFKELSNESLKQDINDGIKQYGNIV